MLLLRLRRLACLAFVMMAAVAADPARGQGGQVLLINPASNASFEAGSTIAIFGRVVDFNGTPIGGAQVNVRLLDPAGVFVAGGSAASSPSDGSFVVPVALPSTLRTGTYTLVLDALDVSIQDRQTSIRIRERFTAPTLPMLVAITSLTVGATAVALVALRPFRRRRKPVPTEG